MRIGTWNVEYARPSRNPDRLALLKTRVADIWILTETNRDLSLCETHCAIDSEPRPSQRKGSTWVTIWSRFPLLRQLEVPDSRRMVAAIFDCNGMPLTVAGVVLPWFSDKGDEPKDPPPTNWSEYRRVFRDELPHLFALLQSESAGSQIVLAGDFNTDLAKPYSCGLKKERGELTQLLSRHSLVYHTADVLYPSSSPPRTLIDHVCSNLGSNTTAETWSGEDGKRPRLSDHPGVIVTWH